MLAFAAGCGEVQSAAQFARIYSLKAKPFRHTSPHSSSSNMASAERKDSFGGDPAKTAKELSQGIQPEWPNAKSGVLALSTYTEDATGQLPTYSPY